MKNWGPSIHVSVSIVTESKGPAQDFLPTDNRKPSLTHNITHTMGEKKCSRLIPFYRPHFGMLCWYWFRLISMLTSPKYVLTMHRSTTTFISPTVSPFPYENCFKKIYLREREKRENEFSIQWLSHQMIPAFGVRLCQVKPGLQSSAGFPIRMARSQVLEQLSTVFPGIGA